MRPLVWSRPTRALIDLAALCENYRCVATLGGPGSAILAVVKADAYGHGAVAVARALETAGVFGFGVATADEGAALRRAGIGQPVLLLNGLFGGDEGVAVRHRLTPVIFGLTAARRLARAATKAGVSVAVHIKVDTGMGRVGIRPDDMGEFVHAVRALPGVVIEGVLTHFAEAEEPVFTAHQIALLDKVVAQMSALGVAPRYVHAANSMALLSGRDSVTNLVRPGLLLYGVTPDGSARPGLPLTPVMTLRTAMAHLTRLAPGDSVSYGRTFTAARETVVAALPVGYADGYPWALGNRAEVLVRGQRAPVIGRVCMDWTMVDVTDVAGVRLGDAVTLWGADGTASLPVSDVAAWAETIPYELLAGVSPRVPRLYAGPGDGP